jgi:hypothetical protein
LGPSPSPIADRACSVGTCSAVSFWSTTWPTLHAGMLCVLTFLLSFPLQSWNNRLTFEEEVYFAYVWRLTVQMVCCGPWQTLSHLWLYHLMQDCNGRTCDCGMSACSHPQKGSQRVGWGQSSASVMPSLENWSIEWS